MRLCAQRLYVAYCFSCVVTCCFAESDEGLNAVLLNVWRLKLTSTRLMRRLFVFAGTPFRRVLRLSELTIGLTSTGQL
jgi:hypothetical protein